MKCPATSELEKLLQDSPLDIQLTAICNHLSECTRCQAELDRLSGASELKPWRTPSSTAASPPAPIGENAVFRVALQQAAKLDTDVETRTGEPTIPESTIDSRLGQLFEPSECESDLGRLAGYRIVREIGRGGAAIVFEAIDTQLDRHIALKLLRPEPQASHSQERFLREAKAIALIRHPNVVAIHSVTATSNNIPILAMELADGGCLQHRIQGQGGLPFRQASQWIAQVADGLAAVHGSGLIHRDIKPSNVLLMKSENAPNRSTSNAPETAKLADFGLVRLAASSNNETQTGMLLGTPAYMSPEHIANFESVDARSDIYSLGATFYESLTGEPPFRGTVAAVLKQIEHDEPTPPRKLNSEIPADLETICLKAMANEPAKRYATATEFSADIRRWLNSEPIRARPVSNLEKLWRWSRRNPGVAGLTGAVASLLLLLAIGSTYAAVSISAVQSKLEDEKENVDQANHAIRAAAADLEVQRQIALESLNGLVTKVQSELAARPGTLKLRESILQTALEGLDKVTKNAGSLASAHTTIQAHIRKGEILDLLGRTAEAITEFGTAATLAQQASDEVRDSVTAQRDLGNALFMQAEVHRKAFAYDLAEPIYQRVLATRQAVADKLPDDSDAQIVLITTMQRLADIHFYRSKWDAAEEAYLNVLHAVERSTVRFPENNTLKRSLVIAHERLGTLATSIGKLDSAEKHFAEVLELNQSLSAADPSNGQYRADMAYITKRLASLASARGDFEGAVRLARDAIDRYIEVAQSDPQDTDAQMKVGAGWQTLYDVELAAGHLEEASKAIEESLNVFATLATNFPTAGKYPSLAMEALIKQADVHFRLGNHSKSIAALEDYSKRFEQYSHTADATPQNYTIALAWIEKSRAALQRAANGLDAIDQLPQLAEDELYLAKTYVMFEQARTGKLEEAMKLGQSLKEYRAKDMILSCGAWLALARGYAACQAAWSAQASNSSDQELNKKSTAARQNCLEAIRLILQVNPSLLEYLRSDSDFQALRGEF